MAHLLSSREDKSDDHDVMQFAKHVRVAYVDRFFPCWHNRERMTGGSNCRHILGLAVLSFALTCVSGRSLEVDIDSFQQWQSQHGRSYNNFGEAAFRQRIFHGNLQKIKAHNEQEHSFKVSKPYLGTSNQHRLSIT